MTALQILGAVILASMFIGFFAFMVVVDGWRVALGVFAIAAATIGVIALGSALLSGELG